jgi:hypothetical protein
MSDFGQTPLAIRDGIKAIRIKLFKRRWGDDIDGVDTEIDESFATLNPGAVKYPAPPWRQSAAPSTLRSAQI